MGLSYESTHEYYMKDPSMYYCAEHNGFCISENYEDTVRFTGVSDKAIIKFVNGLIEHQPELAASFKEIKQVDSKTTRNKKTQSSIKSTD